MPKIKAAPTRVRPADSRRLTPPPKQADPFYLSKEWRALMAAIIKERGRRCQECGRTHNDDGRPVRLYGDHIVELRDGGAPLDPRNIQLLHGACHTAKTVAARAKRMAK